MTKTTDTSSAHTDTYIALITELKKIDKSYLPIRYKEHDSVDSHIDDFLKLFKETKGLGIKAIAPIFFIIDDWSKWALSSGHKYYALAFCEFDRINNRFTAENFLYTKGGVGFSNTILKWLNERELIQGSGQQGRKTLVISLGDNETPVKIDGEEEKSDIIYCEINKNIANSLKVLCGCNTPLEYMANDEPFEVRRDQDHRANLEKNGSELDLILEKIKTQEEDRSKIGYNQLEKPIINHSVYIDEKHYLYYFLSNTVYDQNTDSGKGLGGIYLLVETEVMPVPTLNNDNYSDFVDLWAQLTDKLATRIIHHYENKEKIKNAKMAAIAAVMSRNMSHNIGSHVLVKLSNKNNSSIKKIIDNPRDEIIKVTEFFSYLRTRMDFIADIATGSTNMSFPIKFYQEGLAQFKGGTYKDEDGKIQQDSSGLFLLTNYISGTRITDKLLHIYYYNKSKEKWISNEHNSNDIIFDAANGQLGLHAIYIIIENIIRNSAKHGINEITSKEKLNIIIELNDDIPIYSDLIEVLIYDNLESACKKTDKRQKAFKEINDQIDWPVLGEDFRLRKGGWGVLEMKASACYLRNINILDIDDEHDPKILECLPHKCNQYNQCEVENECENNSIAYKFYLPKPREILFIINQDYVQSETQKNEFKKYGLKIISGKKDITDCLSSIVNYSMMVIFGVDNDINKNIRSNKTALPLRILYEKIEDIYYLNCNISEIIKIFTIKWRDRNLNPHVYINLSEDEKIAWAWNNENIYSSNKSDFAKPFALFDRHGEFERLINSSTPLMYYEKVDQKDQIYKVLSYIPDDPIMKDIVICDLSEISNINILVIDERIQEVICDDQYLKRDLNRMRIYFPNNDMDIDNPNIDKEQIKEWIISKANSFTNQVFIIIHLGVLEKICESDHNLSLLVKSYTNELPDNAELIITSGRGVPSIIKDIGNVRFMHYSSVYKFIIEAKSKYHLAKILYSARRPDK